MFTRIFRIKGTQHWLGPAHPHLYNMTLENVYNPFDADAIWDDQYSGAKGIVNLEGDNAHRWKRLKNALDEHRVTIPDSDKSGRLLGRYFVYTDVVVWISSQIWLEDMAAGAARIKMLAHNLARNHQRDFESSLYRKRPPNYVVMPDDDLDFTQVRFQFGRAVFVPKPQDNLIGKLHFEVLVKNYDLKDKKQIRPWLFFLDGRRRSERYIGLYQDQQSLLISIDSLLARDVQSPYQFAGNQGFILINQLENKSWECFYHEDKKIAQLARSTKEGGTHFLYPNGQISIDGNPVQFTLNLGVRPLTDADIKKYLKMANIEMERAKPAEVKSVSQARENGTAKSSGILPQPYKKPEPVEENYAEFGVTIIPGRNSQSLTHKHVLVAEGVALPRIDDEYAIEGLQSWSLWLDKQGNPVNNPEFNPKNDLSVTTFSANSKSSKLFFRPAQMAHFVPVDDLPMSVPFDNGSIEVVPSPFPQWLGMLQFANPFAFALEDGRYLIGRFNPEPDASQAEIQLDQLTHPNSLQWDNNYGGGHRATFTNLGLSRQHAWVEVQNNKLLVNLALGHRIYYFNKNLESGKCLEAGLEESVLLEDGDRILVGNYLLRFDSFSASV